jgi:hypothetical protein
VLADFRDGLSAELSAAGIVHTVDPRAAQPPYVLIHTPSFQIEAPTLYGNATCVISIGVPPPGDNDAVDQLLPLVDRVCHALRNTVVSAQPGPVPFGTASIPGCRVTVTSPVSL